MQPNQDMQFWLETDASGYATGAVLSQLCADNKWCPIGFTSKSLSPAKRNYEIHDKKLLLVMQGLEEWRHILEGTVHMIEILNDHRNLTYFWMSQNLNCWQAHWSLSLSRFDFSLIHKLGRHSAKADTLSCRVDHWAKEEEDKQDQVMLLPERFHESSELREYLAANRVCPSSITLEGKETDFMNWVHNCTNWDDLIVQVLKELGTEQGLHSNEWQEKDGLVLHRGMIKSPMMVN